MPVREECRYCGNVRKEGVVWYDADYCSGKCKLADGGSVPPAAVVAKESGVKASLLDYYLDYPEKGQKGRTPKRYRRRFEPARLNWGEPMNAPQLKQAGLRANRVSIPGDYDFPVEVTENTFESVVDEQIKEVASNE